MRKYLLIIMSIGLIGLLVTRFVRPGYEVVSDLQLATVEKRSFAVTVHTVGVLDTARSHMVSSAMRGDKGKIIYLIDDGSRVAKGDVLVKLDPTPFENEVHRLKGEVMELEAAVEAAQQVVEWEKSQVEREIRTAEFNLKVAKLELEKLVEGDGPIQLAQFREEMKKTQEQYSQYVSYIEDLEALHNQGYENPTEIPRARAKASELKEQYESAYKKYESYQKHVFPSLKETAKAKVEKAAMEIEQARNSGVFKVAKAVSSLKAIKGKLQTAQSSLELARSELEKTTIAAPFPGIVILYETHREGHERKPRVGDRVWQDQPILYLPDISTIMVKTQVREVNLHKLALNQACTVQVDAYPDTLFEGEVSFIGVLASKRFQGSGGEKYFHMTVSLNGEDSRLRPGMTARVSILTDTVEDALTVPIPAIFNEGEKGYCFRYTGGHFKKVPVDIGKQNEDLTEIVSGLNYGDQVSLVQPPQNEIL